MMESIKVNWQHISKDDIEVGSTKDHKSIEQLIEEEGYVKKFERQLSFHQGKSKIPTRIYSNQNESKVVVYNHTFEGTKGMPEYIEINLESHTLVSNDLQLLRKIKDYYQQENETYFSNIKNLRSELEAGTKAKRYFQDCIFKIE